MGGNGELTRQGKSSGSDRRPAPGPSDYAAIRKDHRTRYGTDIAEFGPRLFEEQYADPTHFLLELLQNAEDALARRASRSNGAPVGERGVTFNLTDEALEVRHFGDPFDREDVRSICGIGRSTKDRKDIGRFGLGFKSVYAFTDRPEIHSGPEDFAIGSYVWPEKADPLDSEPHETVILLPRRRNGADWQSLANGPPEMLSGRHLLFLRHIGEVRWSSPDQPGDQVLRESEEIQDGIRRVTLVGASDEEWLLFERSVRHRGHDAGRVEIGFRLDSEAGSKGRRFPIRSLPKSPLYAFFPTDKETHLGFHIQGPYNTTPARDNVRWPDRWNEHLISETAKLLRNALAWLRDEAEVDVPLLRCLPLDRDRFAGTMFRPLFDEARLALRDDGLLPTEGRSFVPAQAARFGRGAELRSLFSPDHLGELLDAEGPVHWLPREITTYRAAELRHYLQLELGIVELDPESVVDRLAEKFLARQSDDWIVSLYRFLADQHGKSLRASLLKRPILRLADGKQVSPPKENEPGVFFPSDTRTGFRTIRPSVCQGPAVRSFLESLGVREPDLVADIVENVLPRYRDGAGPASPRSYREDLERIRGACSTDSQEARGRLFDALGRTAWIRAMDGKGNDRGWCLP